MTCGALAGCAHVDFGGPGLAYFEPVPYLQVFVAPDCTVSTAVVVLPGTKRYLNFVDGYGSAQLSVNINNGMIASVGQTVDNGGAAAIAAAATIVTAFAARRAGNPACGVVALFPIVDGVAQDQPIVLPIPGTPASGPGRR